MNESKPVYEQIGSLGVIPVVVIEDARSALPLADALLAGGLPVAEITFRTQAAAEAIQTLKRERPGMLLGAGTILTVETLRQAVACGAAFGLAPGFNPEIVREAIKLDFPFAPGVMTPSEVEGALNLGLKVLKLFPAGVAGGVAMLKSLAGPYGHTGVRFVPTGGVTQNNLKEYLELDVVLAVGGTWIASRDDIAKEQWDKIRDHCRQAVEVVAAVKTKSGQGK